MFPDKSGFKFMVSLHLIEKVGISSIYCKCFRGAFSLIMMDSGFHRSDDFLQRHQIIAVAWPLILYRKYQIQVEVYF